MATTTKSAPKLTAAQLIDAQVLKLKTEGATWKFIAENFGWGWNGANMDGGRAKRAFNRAVKAGVDPATVKLSATLTKQLAAAKAPKKAPAKPAAKPTNTRKPRVRKAKTTGDRLAENDVTVAAELAEPVSA